MEADPKRGKRERGENWGRDAKFALIALIRENLKVIENKNLDGDMLRLKKQTWKTIERRMLERGYAFDLVKIKQQWMRLKSAARRNVIFYERYKKHGGHPAKTPSDVDMAVYEVIPEEFERDASRGSISNRVSTEMEEVGEFQDSLTSSSGNWINGEDEIPAVIKEEEVTTEMEEMNNSSYFEGSDSFARNSEDIHHRTTIKRKSSPETMSSYEERRLRFEERRLTLLEEAQRAREAREERLHALKTLKIEKEIKLLDLQIEQQKKKSETNHWI